MTTLTVGRLNLCGVACACIAVIGWAAEHSVAFDMNPRFLTPIAPEVVICAMCPTHRMTFTALSSQRPLMECRVFGVSLVGQRILRLTLDGQVMLTIPATSIPDEYKTNEDGTLSVQLTGIAVAPNGDIYAVDGYGRDFIHRFDKTAGANLIPLEAGVAHRTSSSATRLHSIHDSIRRGCYAPTGFTIA